MAIAPRRGSQGQAPDGTHLDDTVAGGWASGRPRKGSVEIGHVDEKVATQLFFRFHKRAIQYLRLAIGKPYGGRCRAWLEAVAAREDARRCERFPVRGVRRHASL